MQTKHQPIVHQLHERRQTFSSITLDEPGQKENWAVLLFTVRHGKLERSHWTEGKQSEKIPHNCLYTLKKEPRFPFLFTQCKLHTCVRQPRKIWHSAVGFSNQLFKLMLFCDTPLVEMWKENARSCRNFRCIFKLFLPEAWKFDSDRKKKKRRRGRRSCWRAFASSSVWFLTLFTSNLISGEHLAGSWWTPIIKLSSHTIWKHEWVWCRQTDVCRTSLPTTMKYKPY